MATYTQLMQLVMKVGGFRGLRFIDNQLENDTRFLLELDSRERVTELIASIEEADLSGVRLVPNGDGRVIIVLDGVSPDEIIED